MVERYELAGRLERVKVNDPGTFSAMGRLYSDWREVSICNGNCVLGRDCLARFENVPGTLHSSFVTSQIPHHFKGLAPEQYILYGLWRNYMHKEGRYPTLDEINQYFDPGKACDVLFAKEESSGFVSRVMITPRDIFNLETRSYRSIIPAKLPDPRRASRLVLANSRGELGQIIFAIKNAGIIPVEMENLMKTGKSQVA